VFAVSLTVVLALTVGLATSALAAVPGDPFKLGKTKTVDRISPLEGSTASSMLRIDNNGTGSALQLLVEPGKAPLTVNAEAGTAKNLSADELDGKDGSAFFSGKTYNTVGSTVVLAEGQSGFATARCDPGDEVLSGDFNFDFGDSSTVFNRGTSGSTYSAGFRGPRGIVANVTCAGFPPLR
jgi:hypothetical protein